MTVWIEFEDEKLLKHLVGREFAMVYGDYCQEVKELTENFDIDVFF